MANPNSLPWTFYQDIQVPEEQLRKQFNAYVNEGNFVEAIRLLTTQRERLKGRAYVSRAINEIVSNVLAIEGYYNDGVYLFLSDLAEAYFDLVDNFRSKGEWSIGVQYKPYNFVYYQDDVYMAISSAPIGQPPAEDEYWIRIGLEGEVGAPGIDVNVKFRWNPTQAYKERDLVSYGSDLYVAQKPSTGVEPGTDDSTWLPFLIVARGKINVGMTAPVNPVQNTIWFKAPVDPVATTGDIVGEMFRSRTDGTWEPMYSSTLFTLVQGREPYAPLATTDKLIVQPSQWIASGGKYSMDYRNDKIVANSNVSVGCNLVEAPEEFRVYSDAELSVDVGVARFTLPYKPTMPLHLYIKIQ